MATSWSSLVLLDGCQPRPRQSSSEEDARRLPSLRLDAGVPDVALPEKRKVGSSTLPLTTSFRRVSSALTSANTYRVPACTRPSSDHDCPCVTVISCSLSHADRTPRLHVPGSGPLRPELAALLGVCPLSQPGWCAGSCASWRLAGDVAVLSRCTWTGDSLLAKVVAATGGPAAAQLKSSAACYVNDRESPYATFLTARGGHRRGSCMPSPDHQIRRDLLACSRSAGMALTCWDAVQCCAIGLSAPGVIMGPESGQHKGQKA